MSTTKKYKFNAEIYKIGINWCVDVPTEITDHLTSEKGRINIKGQINSFDFIKTLMPVKNSSHRLFVNQAMITGGETALGQTATFIIEQDTEKIVKEYPAPLILTEQLEKHNLKTEFDNLTASRKQDILKYLNYVKTESTLLKNIDKLIIQLKSKDKNVRIP